MRYRGTTRKQARYAYNLMNTNLSRKDAMLASGYSESASLHAGRVENSDGFKLAMAKQAFEAGNIASGIMHEMQVRGYKYYDTKELLQALDVISKAFERFTPKEKQQSSNSLTGAFGRVIDIEPEKPLETKDETASTLDNVASDDVIDTTS